MEERQCSICGRETERLTEFDGQLMCQSCLNELTSVCRDCGRRLYNDNTYGDENTILCENCYNNFYVHCSECDALIYNDNAYYELSSDEPLCSRCFDELEENPIKNYGKEPIKDISDLTNILAKNATVRGTDATGIAFNHNRRLTIHKEAKSAYMMKLKHPSDVICVTGHTRHATQGDKKKNYNNHQLIQICLKK